MRPIPEKRSEAIAAVGVARSAYEHLLDWSKKYPADGDKPTISHQAVGYLLAATAMKIEACRALVRDRPLTRGEHFVTISPGYRGATMKRVSPNRFIAAFLVVLCIVWYNAAKAEEWAPVDCSASHMILPFKFPYQCRQAPEGNGSSTNGRSSRCTYRRISASGSDSSRSFIAWSNKGSESSCFVFGTNDEAVFPKNADPFVKANAQAPSDLKQFGSMNALTFTANGTAGPMNCYAFHKLGPARGGGYSDMIAGHICHRDGAPVTDAEIQQTVGAMSRD